MALTSSVAARTVIGDRRLTVTNLTFDASYATGGYAVTPSTFGVSVVDAVLADNPSGYDVFYNAATGKVQVFASGNTEVAAATNLSAVTAHAVTIGH